MRVVCTRVQLDQAHGEGLDHVRGVVRSPKLGQGWVQHEPVAQVKVDNLSDVGASVTICKRTTKWRPPVKRSPCVPKTFYSSSHARVTSVKSVLSLNFPNANYQPPKLNFLFFRAFEFFIMQILFATSYSVALFSTLNTLM